MKKNYGSRSLRHEHKKQLEQAEEIEELEVSEDLELPTEETGFYSRRHKSEASFVPTREKKPRLMPADWLFIGLVSLVLSLSFYAFPMYSRNTSIREWQCRRAWSLTMIFGALAELSFT